MNNDDPITFEGDEPDPPAYIIVALGIMVFLGLAICGVLGFALMNYLLGRGT